LIWSKCLKQAIQAQRRQARQLSRRPASKAVRCRPVDPSVPLGDGLCYCVLARPVRDGRYVWPGDAARAADVARVFPDAFGGVWQHIPRPDRECLSAYWREPQAVALYGGGAPRPRHLPLIQVVEADPDPDEPGTCRNFGFELTFQACLVLDESHRLRGEIACALAQTLRCATRRHWALQLSKLEEPMERWERRQHGQATEQACRRLGMTHQRIAHIPRNSRPAAARPAVQCSPCRATFADRAGSHNLGRG
jgi:hypothetical protein